MTKTITALTLDLEQDGWDTSRGFIKRDVVMPTLDEATNIADASSVIIKVQFAGLCGSDRGIWNRAAFSDMIRDSLADEDNSLRVLGHEFVGEIVETGSQVSRLAIGDTVSGDSHVTCGECYQCKKGEEEVCQNQSILGISIDGIYAEYVKVPAKNLWKVDTSLIRPEVAAVFDPFGNAVHSLSKATIQGATVAVFGCGQIGMFSILLANTMGAAKVIAVDVSEENLATAKQLGAHETVLIDLEASKNKDNNYDIDAAAVAEIVSITNDTGVDVSLEMAGFNSSVNNCIAATRDGGDVILFGIKDGDFVIPNFSNMIVKGITLHNVIGRQIFQTWETANQVLADTTNGVQDHIWNTILKGGAGTVVKLSEFSPEVMEEKMKQHPKIIFDIQN